MKAVCWFTGKVITSDAQAGGKYSRCWADRRTLKAPQSWLQAADGALGRCRHCGAQAPTLLLHATRGAPPRGTPRSHQPNPPAVSMLAHLMSTGMKTERVDGMLTQLPYLHVAAAGPPHPPPCPIHQEPLILEVTIRRTKIICWVAESQKPQTPRFWSLGFLGYLLDP